MSRWAVLLALAVLLGLIHHAIDEAERRAHEPPPVCPATAVPLNGKCWTLPAGLIPTTTTIRL